MPDKNAPDPRCWMPLLIDKYLGDTTDLTTEQHGAYLLLLMAMWKRKGHLPTDEQRLREITKLSPAKWKRSRDLLLSYFTLEVDGYTQKRLMCELTRAEAHIEARSQRGSKAAAKRWKKGNSTYENSPSPTPSKPMPQAMPQACTSNAASMPQALPEHAPSNAPRNANGNASAMPDPMLGDTPTPIPIQRDKGARSNLPHVSRAHVSEQARAREGESPPEPPSDEAPPPSPAGAVCRAMRTAGLQAVNPGDPRLLALIGQGATAAEFAGIAAEAVGKGKGFAWVLATLQGRRSEAAAIALAPAVQPPPAGPTEAERTAEYLRDHFRERTPEEQAAAEAARQRALAKVAPLKRSQGGTTP